MEFCPDCGRVVQPGSRLLLVLRREFEKLRATPPDSRTRLWVPTYKRQGKKPWVAAGLALALGTFWAVGNRAFLRWKVCAGHRAPFHWTRYRGTILVQRYTHGHPRRIRGDSAFGLFFVGGWLWQAFDAYNAAQSVTNCMRQCAREIISFELQTQLAFDSDWSPMTLKQKRCPLHTDGDTRRRTHPKLLPNLT